MRVDLVSLNKLVDSHYLSVQSHPYLPFLIYNYTEKCQYERYWTEETLMCRGLIVNPEGKIVARPFKKFFNLGEHTGEDSKLPPLPLEDFEVFDKLDGSLGILYSGVNGRPTLATRGSFTSEQALRGTEILNSKYDFYADAKYTYLFEIIYPENRIVVDYAGRRDCVLLAVIDTETGLELSYDKIRQLYGGFIPIVERFDGITDLNKIKELNRDNAEGFVIRFKNGTRAKLKYDEYVRLHRLVTGVNAKTIWEHLKDGTSLEEMLERVPDEFSDWVVTTMAHLQTEFEDIQQRAYTLFLKIQKIETRKDQALKIKDSPFRGIVFKMLDKQDYDQIIWKMIRPVAEKPWREDIDG